MGNWQVQTPPPGEVNSVAISSNGQTVVAGTYYFEATPPSDNFEVGTYVYKANGDLLVNDTFPPKPDLVNGNYANGIYWVAMSRDGKWAASGGGGPSTNPLDPLGEGYVYAYEVARGNKRMAEYKGNIGRVNMVALSGDGSYLVAGADATYVFSRRDGQFGVPLKKDLHSLAGVKVPAVAISDDGRWIVYGTQPSDRTAGWVVLSPNQAASRPVGSPPNAPAAEIGETDWQLPDNQYVMSVAMASDGSGFAVVATNHHNAAPLSIPVVCNVYFFSMNCKEATYFPTCKQPAWSQKLGVETSSGFQYCTGTLSVAVSDRLETADEAHQYVSAVGNMGVTGSSMTGYVFFLDVIQRKQCWNRPTEHGPNSTSMDKDGQFVTVADGYQQPGKFYLFDQQGNSQLLDGPQPSQMAWPMQISADASAIAAGSDDSKVYYFALTTKAARAATAGQRTSS